MRAVTALAIAVASAATPACVACRPAAPLDVDERAELEEIRGRILAADVRIVVTPQGDQGATREVLLAFEEARLPTYRSGGSTLEGDVMLEVQRVPHASSASDTWAAALSTISLGLIPYFNDGQSTYAIRWTKAGDVVREATCKEEIPTVFGWIAPLIALRDQWRLGGTPVDGTPERRATLARLGLCLARSIDAWRHTNPSELPR